MHAPSAGAWLEGSAPARAIGVQSPGSAHNATSTSRRLPGAMPESLDQAKSRMQDMAGYVGQKTKEVGQEIQRKAHDGK
ncbi:OLEOSIN [Salix koriyanagi]|uniref:OLEOSIN n=1 Tax=Salix koriyanagi TaxID=2511006 RepID=A0A9Q0WYF9_9ROSI|nr:OLEOSIN [Salix koriyanagi]